MNPVITPVYEELEVDMKAIKELVGFVSFDSLNNFLIWIKICLLFDRRTWDIFSVLAYFICLYTSQ